MYVSRWQSQPSTGGPRSRAHSLGVERVSKSFSLRGQQTLPAPSPHPPTQSPNPSTVSVSPQMKMQVPCSGQEAEGAAPQEKEKTLL